MTVYFATPVPLDIRAVLFMGVSVKEEGAIGMFGTGLKYAFAWLLRNGHKITLEIEGKNYPIEARRETVRGKEFEFVYIDSQPAGFTTALGKNWEDWQVFRELHSNVLDEKGEVTNHPVSGVTLISITGPAIEECYNKRDEIFLRARTFLGDQVSYVRKPSGFCYYRGMRAGNLQYPSVLTWSIEKELQLTEDRTIRYWWHISTHICHDVQQSTDEQLIASVLLAPKGTFEHEYLSDWSNSNNASEVYNNFCFANRHNPKMNQSALRLWRESDPRGKEALEELYLPPHREAQLKAAITLVNKLIPVERNDITVYKSLGADVLGKCEAGKIAIAEIAFIQGSIRLAGTIFEEVCHRDGGYDDCSRSFQNYIIDLLFDFVSR